MSRSELKLSYNAHSFRIKIEGSADDFLKQDKIPKDILDRAYAKLNSEKDRGNIAHVFDYQKQIESAVQNIKNKRQFLTPETKFSFPLLVGVPRLVGLKISVTKQPNTAFVISIDAPLAVVKTWHLEWILALARRDLDLAKMNHIFPNTAQVHAALTKAQSGMKINSLPIGINSNAAELRAQGKMFAISVNKQRYEMSLVVSDEKYLRQAELVQALIHNCNNAAQKIGSDIYEFQFQKADLVEKIRQASHSWESIGVGLPLSLCIGWGQKTPEVAKPAPSEYPGKSKLKVDISDDKMKATITGFEASWFEESPSFLSKDWVQYELDAMKITHGYTDTIKAAFADMVVNKKDLNGFVIAEGDPGAGASKAFLYKSYADAKQIQENSPEKVDIREMQQRKLVRIGQLVAEIKHKVPARAGFDIYGKVLAVPDAEKLEVSLGEGVECRDGNKYFALVDGIPQVDESSIAINRVFVHQGDVNLRTGNIHFDGDVEITGSIDSGATVEVKGNLTVGGTIRDAFVKVGGDLEARMGIVTGDVGKIHVMNKVNADFVENSTVICGGDLSVKKVLLNSRVVSGGNIKLNEKDGILAGGEVSCRGSIVTAKLGFPKGAVTKVTVGVDWRAELRLRIREARMKKVEVAHENDRQQIRELSRRKENQIASKHKEMMEVLKNRITRGRLILEKLKAHYETAKAALTYDAQSFVVIVDVLYSNCSVNLGGETIPITQDVAAVKIQGKKVKGSNIVALAEEPKANDPNNPTNNAA